MTASSQSEVLQEISNTWKHRDRGQDPEPSEGEQQQQPDGTAVAADPVKPVPVRKTTKVVGTTG